MLSTDFEIQNVRVLASQVILDSALVVLQPRAPLRKVARVQLPHSAHAAVQRPERSGGAQRQRRARLHETHGRVRDSFFWDNDAGSKIHLLANPGQELGSLQYPHNPMKGALEHFHFLSVRNIDIGRVGYLRHSFIAGFPTERAPKMPLSGVSTRSGNLARFTFKGLDGTMTDLFIHLAAYQLATLSGTGVLVLD